MIGGAEAKRRPKSAQAGRLQVFLWPSLRPDHHFCHHFFFDAALERGDVAGIRDLLGLKVALGQAGPDFHGALGVEAVRVKLCSSCTIAH